MISTEINWLTAIWVLDLGTTLIFISFIFSKSFEAFEFDDDNEKPSLKRKTPASGKDFKLCSK